MIMVPNSKYSGPVKPTIKRFEEIPFTSTEAELNAVLAGSVDYGYIPTTDLKLTSRITKNGFSVQPWLNYGYTGLLLTYPDRTAGPLLDQLYIRQAMQDLINQPEYIKDIYGGYATPTYSSVPSTPQTDLVSSALSSNPYPYNPGSANQLLTANGWTVVSNGLSTCSQPGTGSGQCGAGITKGEGLNLNLIYAAGNPEYDAQFAVLKSSFATAGIQLAIKSEPPNLVGTNAFNCVPATGAGCGNALTSWFAIGQLRPAVLSVWCELLRVR